jgi:caffeoyl-CoA O-methyltransferase
MTTEKALEAYLLSNSTNEDPILNELNRETHLKVLNPRMLSGHLQGLLLELISKIVAPKHILEIGTYTGYSAICLAKGLQNGGILHTIDCNDELLPIQNKFIKKAGMETKIKIHTGDALEIIPRLSLEFDLIFIDADKQQYCDYYKLIINKMRSGGIILADNVLWDGKVLDPKFDEDSDTRAIKAFNKMIHTDPRVESIIIPIRDGISLIRKI